MFGIFLLGQLLKHHAFRYIFLLLVVKKDTMKSNRDFWIPKIERNMQRDKKVNQQFTEMGYTIFKFWENEVKKNLKNCINTILVCLDWKI
jgi:DNA mismatch endonuclease Vsr